MSPPEKNKVSDRKKKKYRKKRKKHDKEIDDEDEEIGKALDKMMEVEFNKPPRSSEDNSSENSSSGDGDDDVISVPSEGTASVMSEKGDEESEDSFERDSEAVSSFSDRSDAQVVRFDNDDVSDDSR